MPMQSRSKRWQSVQWLVIVLGVFLIGECLYFTSIRASDPPSIQESYADVNVEFTVDKAAVLTLEDCVRGRWSAEGAKEVRINGGVWKDDLSGSYTLCNQPNLSPTLEVRPPSAIPIYTLNVTVIFGNGLHMVAGLALLFIAMWVWGVQLWSHRRLILLVMGIHIALVIIYQLTTNLNISNPWVWDTVVHTLEMGQLRRNLAETFIYLHSQPPLFSIYGVVLDILFGNNHPQAMYVIQVTMGTLISGITYSVLWHFTQNKTVTLFVSLLLALNPAYFLYEALMLYTIHAAFLVMSAGFCLLLYRRTLQSRYLYLFVLCINLLILLRSVYHIAFLIPVLVLVMILVEHNWRRVLIGCLMICLLSVGWYGKNWLVFDTFSSSSWLGMSLWKVARYDYSDDELQDLFKADVLTNRTVVWFRPFMNPSAYPGFEPIDSEIYILSRDTLNNAVYPKVNALYMENALHLIGYDIGRYLKGVTRAYGHYSCPSSTYDLMENNIKTFPASHQAASVELFHMRGLTQEIARRLNLSPDDYGACSNLYLILPLIMLGYPIYLLYRHRWHWRGWVNCIRQDSLLLFSWGIITYTTVITSLLEIPENARFKFMIEVPLFIFIVVMMYRFFAAYTIREA